MTYDTFLEPLWHCQIIESIGKIHDENQDDQEDQECHPYGIFVSSS